ncbi:unnamed protein product [Discula destructiva]
MAASAILLAAALVQLCHCHVVTGAASALPQTAPPQARPLSKLHGRFLHITDFHPDQFYKIHTSTSADHACHSGKGPAGTYGAETSDCDAPLSLVNATFDWISANVRNDIDFVVWTGDSARHDSDEAIPRSPAQVLGTNRLLATKFADTFSDAHGLAIPVVPNFGNNDILPHNILLPGPNKWLSAYAEIWNKFIPEEQRHSFEFGGWFYVEVIPNHLAVFSLNTLYLFDRNAAVDDCVKPSEPGYKHMEWLRIQLQFMRDRGMKAILIGHVPPARTDSKMLWDETCWQKYTLWLRQYRDVVIAGLYGHMNIDHFMISDTRDISIDLAQPLAEHDTLARNLLEDELSVQSATDYLEELRQGWAKLPKVHVDSVETNSKKHKGKKDKGKRIAGKWAERYQLSFVSPSIVPNYFPTLRVYEYNITGIEDAMTWAESTKPLPVTGKPNLEVQNSWLSEEGPELELRSLSDPEVSELWLDDVGIDHVETGKKKPKKGKKKPKKDKPQNPDLHIPHPPAKTSPPGPAYSLQALTLLGYEQYFANLTHINNVDVANAKEQGSDLWGPTKWREGKHGDKVPKSKKPKPREFKFEIEYTTYDDKLYGLKDLTVRSFVDLAYRMGQSAKGKSAQVASPSSGHISDDFDDGEEAEGKYPNLEAAESDDDDDGNLEKSDNDVENFGKKKPKGDERKKRKKKKKKKKKKKFNKTWLHFLKHAFVSTIEDDELKEKFS